MKFMQQVRVRSADPSWFAVNHLLGQIRPDGSLSCIIDAGSLSQFVGLIEVWPKLFVLFPEPLRSLVLWQGAAGCSGTFCIHG